MGAPKQGSRCRDSCLRGRDCPTLMLALRTAAAVVAAALVAALGVGAHGHEAADASHEHHEVMQLTAATWDQTIRADQPVWAVKFHSSMCGSCQDFVPEWDRLQAAVDGLHWGELNVDNKANLPIAQKYGVLAEGIPNVKLFNLTPAPLPVLTGDEETNSRFLKGTIKQALAAHGAVLDDRGFYVSSGSAKDTEL